MGKITLFGIEASPSVRAVLLTLKALNLPYDYVEISLFAREELSQEFYKKHPRQTVPTLEDDDNNVYESHAIIVYLVEKYAETDDLYPKDLIKRAQVDERLYFESGIIFFGAFRNSTRPALMKDKADVEKYKIDDIIDIYNIIEVFLKEHLFIAGDQVTIADFSFISSVITLGALVSIDRSKYGKLTAWIERIKQLPYYKVACGKGADKLETMIQSKNINIIP